MTSRFSFLQQWLDELVPSGSLRTLRACEIAVASGEPATVIRGGRRLVNFGSNDYLGLAAAPSVDPTALPRGSGASPLVCGYTALHEQLCEALAELERTEAVALFPTGYAACSGVVSTLPQRGDLILSDALNHASLIDGCRLSRAEKRIYPHADVAAVAELLVRHRREFERVWIVTDGVFGMDGDLSPLVELCDLADRHDALLIVDEAHGTGVLGEDGSGACAALGVKSRVPIRIGTLSKAIGAQGGFVAGPRPVIDYLINFCRPLIFSTAAAPAVIAAALAGVNAVREEPQRRERVRRFAVTVRQALEILADDIAAEIPIIPIVVGDNAAAVRQAVAAEAAGMLIPAIRPPTVPEGTARLRVSLSAGHDQEQIDRLIDFLRLICCRYH